MKYDDELSKLFAEYTEYRFRYETLEQDGTDYILATASSEDDGGQFLIQKIDGSLEIVAADTVIDIALVFDRRTEWFSTPIPTAGECLISSEEDHQKVFDAAADQVGKFSSSEGPDNGNLACVWVVRKIVFKAINRSIHGSNATARFYPELKACFDDDSLIHEDVLPGGIVISPTVYYKGKSRNIGHVGILGAGKGVDRKIYSNSSSKAMWVQNHTIESWNEKYVVGKGLKVFYFPLPYKPEVTIKIT